MLKKGSLAGKVGDTKRLQPYFTFTYLKKGEKMYSRMEKYGRKAQRFSIRKYSFGAASVLVGTALLFGANAVKADETSAASVNSVEVTNF